MSRAKILVGIPAYNEERAIGDVVARSIPHATEVVVVDDGSTDLTAFRALSGGATLIRFTHNQGKGATVAALFEYAHKHGADVLVLIDGDGQHDPDEIPLVAAPCLDGSADVVVGSRFLRGAQSETPKLRRIGQQAFNAMTMLASGVRCSDSQSGFRAFRRRAFCAMRLSETSFSVECEMQFECQMRGLRLAEVPISCRYDQPPKRNVVAQGVNVLFRLTRMAVRRRLFGRVPAPTPPVARPAVVSRPRFGASATNDGAVSAIGAAHLPARVRAKENWNPLASSSSYPTLDPPPASGQVSFRAPRPEHRPRQANVQRVVYEAGVSLRRPLISGMSECVGIGRGPPGRRHVRT